MSSNLKKNIKSDELFSQLELFKSEKELGYRTKIGSESQIGTFRVNKESPVHRWYPYVEGFSADRIINLIKKYHLHTSSNIYDPFGGSGTVQTIASHLGLNSYYSELNPFMQLVAETKVNVVQSSLQNKKVLTELENYYDFLITHDVDKHSEYQDTSRFHKIFPERDYFIEEDLKKLVYLLELGKNQSVSDNTKDLLSLAIYCIAIDCSNMTRRADLRRRRSDEYKSRVVDVKKFYSNKILQIIEDLTVLSPNLGTCTRISHSCLDYALEYSNKLDLIITSPPYLNGTNYFRNTKIEMALAGLLNSDKDLRGFRQRAITAGINNVSSRRSREIKDISFIANIVQELEEKTYDQRIPKLVSAYFSDMSLAAKNFYDYLKEGSYFVCDIGDSIFANVHVPTHTILGNIFSEAGFEIIELNTLRQRYSYNKQPLGQYEIILRK